MKTAIIDCETTGLTLPSLAELAQQPRIIEFAGALVEGGAIVERFERMINPGCSVTEEITKITGITNDDLKDKPTFEKVAEEIRSFLEKASTLIAHNAPFDCACIEFEFARIGKPIALPPAICTVQEFAHEFGRRPKLTELYERKLGKPLVQTHRALDDVCALAEIVIKESLA